MNKNNYKEIKPISFRASRFRKLARTITGRFPSQYILGSRVYIRSPRRKDWKAWVSLRKKSYNFLRKWEPSWTIDDCNKKTYLRQLRIQKIKAINDLDYNFLCFDIETDNLLGGINISNVQRGVTQTANIGYWLGEEFTKKGYMNESILAMFPFIFVQMKFNRLQAFTLPENTSSRKLLEGLEFKKEGLIRNCMKINNIWRDHLLYSKLAKDYIP